MATLVAWAVLLAVFGSVLFEATTAEAVSGSTSGVVTVMVVTTGVPFTSELTTGRVSTPVLLS